MCATGCLALVGHLLMPRMEPSLTQRSRILDITHTFLICVADWQTIAAQILHGDNERILDHIPA